MRRFDLSKGFGMRNCLEKIEQMVSDWCGVSFEGKQHFFRTHLLKAMENFEVLECSKLYELLQTPGNFERFLSFFLVSQSYFFREKRHFEVLVELIKKSNQGFTKILSIPCANGEEPYSLAIYLLESGITEFLIEAFDINKAAIQKALQGVYDDRDLANLPQTLKNRYFIPTEEGYRVTQEVRDRVVFEVCNLFELTKNGYDYIFCRNLMIYLTQQKQQEALAIFHQILNDEGYLFLSFSDYVSPMEGFDKISLENIYKKRVL